MRDSVETFILKTFSLLEEESNVLRYSKNRPVLPENLLEHVGWVTSWCLLVGKDLESRFNLYIDYGTMLSGAVIHDFDEIILGDIVNPTKYASKAVTKSLKELEDCSVSIISKFLNYAEDTVDLEKDFKQAKGTKTIEQVIVSLADLACVVYKVWVEVYLKNNKSFLRVAKEVETTLSLTHKFSNLEVAPKIQDYITTIVVRLQIILHQIIYSHSQERNITPITIE